MFKNIYHLKKKLTKLIYRNFTQKISFDKANNIKLFQIYLTRRKVPVVAIIIDTLAKGRNLIRHACLYI